MILLNFAHPLTAEQLEQLRTLTGADSFTVYDLPAQFDADAPFEAQLAALLSAVPLTATQWQTEPIVVNPPSLNFIAVLLLADLHGRMGYFPAHIRLRRLPDSLPPRFEIAEVLNLQAIRERARHTRTA